MFCASFQDEDTHRRSGQQPYAGSMRPGKIAGVASLGHEMREVTEVTEVISSDKIIRLDTNWWSVKHTYSFHSRSNESTRASHCSCEHEFELWPCGLFSTKRTYGADISSSLWDCGQWEFMSIYLRSSCANSYVRPNGSNLHVNMSKCHWRELFLWFQIQWLPVALYQTVLFDVLSPQA